MEIGIIGCDINGAYLAWKFAEKGHDVMVFDQRKKIGKEACSGLISQRIWDFIPENRRLVKHKIYSVHVHFPKKTLEMKFNPEMLVFDRKKLDNYVLDLARKAGANINLGKTFSKIFYYRGKRPQISVFNEKGKSDVYQFDVVIGSDGASSDLRNELGLNDPDFRLGIMTYKREKGKDKHVDVWPTQNGFKWKIPRKTNVEYGIMENLDVAKKEFKKFAKAKKIYSAVIPQGNVSTGRKYAALCGDAAGLTKPWSGGGVIWGLTAADILIDSFPNMLRYNRRMKTYFRFKSFVGKLVMKIGTFIGNNTPFLLPKTMRFDSDWVL